MGSLGINLADDGSPTAVCPTAAGRPDIIRSVDPVQDGSRTRAEARAGANEAGKDPDRLEIICKIRCSIAREYAVARDALSHALTYYALADYYRELLGRMGFGAEVEAMRAAWKTGGFHAARKLVTDEMFRSLPLVAATSAPEVVRRLKPFIEAGATRIILPYVTASDDVVGEIKSFIQFWSPAITGNP